MMHSSQLSPSWDPVTEETALFLLKFWVPLASGPTAEQKQKILHPALLRGRERCGHHLPMSSLLPLWVARLRASCTRACCQVWQGPGRAGRPACDRLHDAAWWKAATAAWERGWPQGVPTATNRLRGCSRGGRSRIPPTHGVFERLSLLLCCRELLGKALDSVAEEAGL